LLDFSCSGICGEAAAAHAQGEAPQTINTRLEVRTVGSNLGVTMKEIAAAADSPIWTGYEVAGVPGEHRRLLRELQGKARMDIRMAFGIWKKSTEMAAETGGTKRM